LNSKKDKKKRRHEEMKKLMIGTSLALMLTLLIGGSALAVGAVKAKKNATKPLKTDDEAEHEIQKVG
jgi:hypothetical protein